MTDSTRLPKPNSRPGLARLAPLALAPLSFVLAACGGSSDSDSTPDPTPPLPPSSSATPADTQPVDTQPTEEAPPGGAFVAGSYQAEGAYTNPDGSAMVGVEIEIDAAGVITSVEVTPEASGGNALLFQTRFSEGIADEVVGKPITELDVSKVAGSSLTSTGFNDAVEQIIADATA